MFKSIRLMPTQQCQTAAKLNIKRNDDNNNTHLTASFLGQPG